MLLPEQAPLALCLLLVFLIGRPMPTVYAIELAAAPALLPMHDSSQSIVEPGDCMAGAAVFFNGFHLLLERD